VRGGDFEDEVRAALYGRHTGAVTRKRLTADGPAGASRRDDDRPPAGRRAPRSGPHRERAGRPQSELAAALLGKLDASARERALGNAVEMLSKRALGAEARGRARRTDAGAPRTDRVDDMTQPRVHGRSGHMRAAVPPSGLAGTRMARYRIVIERLRGPGRRVEFSARAPSARGAVAAELGDGRASVSAVNEAEPADRFSWSVNGPCACTPVAIADAARGGKLDADGTCPACGLVVLPPHEPP
jgi:hypothetical protein